MRRRASYSSRSMLSRIADSPRLSSVRLCGWVFDASLLKLDCIVRTVSSAIRLESIALSVSITPVSCIWGFLVYKSSIHHIGLEWS